MDKNSGFNIDEQLVEVNKLSKRNNNAVANIQDYKLSRYICYLIVWLNVFIIEYIAFVRLNRKIQKQIDAENIHIFSNTIIPFDKSIGSLNSYPSFFNSGSLMI